MKRPDTFRIHRFLFSFGDAVRFACECHEREDLGIATHCAVNPNEPARVAQVGSVQIVTAEDVPVGQMWAYRDDGHELDAGEGGA